MSDPGGIALKLKADLERYVKPREQVNYIRRILALHLGSFTGDGPVTQPLSLVDGVLDVDSGQALSGLHKEYIDALKANAAARREFDKVLRTATSQPEARPQQPSSEPDFLHEQLALLQMQRKKKCLLAIEACLDRLAEKPASFHSFLDSEDIFHGSKPLPSVPQAVLNSFVREQSSAGPDLHQRLHQLEKTVLRSKLLLKQEERVLAEARARCSKSSVSNGAKLEALNATRDELIAWIETELGKASSEESEDVAKEASEGQAQESKIDQGAVTTRLQQIQHKYSAYVAARKGLVELLARRPQPSIPPPTKQPNITSKLATGSADPVTHLLTPYIEGILSVSRQQKAAITQKSHIATVLSKRSKDTRQVLDRLAEESQLLPAHQVKDSRTRRAGLDFEMASKSSDRDGVAPRVKPWVLAADAAKIANLEAVAETIDGGQAALESSMTSLLKTYQLLGRSGHVSEEDAAVEDATDDDVWLGGGERSAAVRKHSQKETKPALQNGDPWSILHGNLGLIGHDDAE
ncbi:hypothetical protein JDV02_001642 [Purpureocillium takamizusanense]|uniref:Uncharacterized protein n=1 Tax=Purpureocillium takamizusanense TaxID=2060973 RepID=A0A9Q8Q9A2_9HYPO|nr:uncharacterized protein JDV02_001642 [Purpureocillium takamizusanense]UNI15072.1 hypothetical protein JDV02_001642 [Purpureocillium takamizusanense]